MLNWIEGIAEMIETENYSRLESRIFEYKQNCKMWRESAYASELSFC